MARTFRKRKESFDTYFDYLNHIVEHGVYKGFPFPVSEEEIEKTKEDIKKYKYKFKTSSKKWYSGKLPKHFRKMVNRARRTKSKHEVWKEVNWKDYPGQGSMYNCKDNNHWGYW